MWFITHNTNIFHNVVRSPTCRQTADKQYAIIVQLFNTLAEQQIKSKERNYPSCHI